MADHGDWCRELVVAGLARLDGDRLALTPQGLLVSNAVVADLFGASGRAGDVKRSGGGEERDTLWKRVLPPSCSPSLPKTFAPVPGQCRERPRQPLALVSRKAWRVEAGRDVSKIRCR